MSTRERMTLIFLFLLRRQLERNILESLKSICPFDFTLLLIMKYEIEVFPCLLSTVEIVNISHLFNHIFGKPYINVGVLISLQNKVSVVSGSLEFCEKGGGKLSSWARLEKKIPPPMYAHRSHMS